MKTPSYRAFKTFAELARIRPRTLLAVPEKTAAPAGLPETYTDAQLFALSMRDVIPLGWSTAPSRPPQPLEIPNILDSEDEGLRLLQEFVSGKGRLDLTVSGEYVEGTPHPEGRRWIGGLRSGRFSVQAHLDLHGLGVTEARKAFEDFIGRSLKRGHGCVRIVHGRGNHSQEGQPMLKEKLPQWLDTRRMSRCVIAYASARLSDGGGGALYILLRRN
jgi:DNA-nicking Smr family endonuclease